MPVIIVATDFSKVAQNALKYACDMALAQSADVALIHTYTIPIALGDLSVAMPISDFRIDAEDGMNKAMSAIRQSYPQLNFKSAILYGDIIDGVNQFIEQNEAPMLVVTGNSYTPEKPAWMDSTLLEAFRHLQYPILAVPEDSQYTHVRKIGFVYDNIIDKSRGALQQTTAIAALLGAELHIYHADAAADKDTMEINREAKEILSPAHPLYHYSNEPDIDDDILTFIGKYQLDWLLVMPRKHSFFEGLFHKSHTKSLINSVFIPILALHESER